MASDNTGCFAFPWRPRKQRINQDLVLFVTELDDQNLFYCKETKRWILIRSRQNNQCEEKQICTRAREQQLAFFQICDLKKSPGDDEFCAAFPKSPLSSFYPLIEYLNLLIWDRNGSTECTPGNLSGPIPDPKTAKYIIPTERFHTYSNSRETGKRHLLIHPSFRLPRTAEYVAMPILRDCLARRGNRIRRNAL